MAQTIKDIIKSFSLLDDWEDRYRYVIELSHELPPYPESSKDSAHKIPGCISQAWLICKRNGNDNDPILTFKGDSDSYIVKGLMYIMLALYSGRLSSDILAINAEEILIELGLNEHLTPQRSNGARSIIARIREEAGKHKQATP
ncbi:MAG: cysteine desulfuration protein SufE [Candidatus Tokpelaia sp. JSC188]|nr:MAG: cysteine desulfuration protein SufE [Candidatus Tokpelaia sp. JSC188]